MQILLSPAKDMASAPNPLPHLAAQPRFQAEAERCALQMAELPAEKIAQLLHVNPRLAALTRQRYHDFLDPADRSPALLAYTGMAYRHLRAASFTAADLRFAQDHLWITSFLYGLNRPLDEIKPYRLEGNVVLPDHDGKTLFRFWRDRLTDVFIESILADDGVLINLASAEMKQLFHWRRVEQEVRVVAPEFLVETGERRKTVVVYAKMMRGALARHLLLHRSASPADLCRFDYEGFVHRPELSAPDRPVWVAG